MAREASDSRGSGFDLDLWNEFADAGNDGADRTNEDGTCESDPHVGFLTSHFSDPAEEITIVNRGNPTADANGEDVLVRSESFDPDNDNTFDAVSPGSSLTRQ